MTELNLTNSKEQHYFVMRETWAQVCERSVVKVLDSFKSMWNHTFSSLNIKVLVSEALSIDALEFMPSEEIFTRWLNYQVIDQSH